LDPKDRAKHSQGFAHVFIPPHALVGG
jgi:hypothetical protein